MSISPSSNGHTRQPRRESDDLVMVDYTKLQWHIRRNNISLSRFADESALSRASIYRIRDGHSVRRSTVALAAEYLKIGVEDLLEATQVELSPEELASSWRHPEWEVIPETLEPLVLMSNGLIMRVAKVRHRVLENEFGRAKVYDIRGMPLAVRDQCRQSLSRHAEVSRRLTGCPFVSDNLTMTSLHDGGIWTLVDRWIDAARLSEELEHAPLPITRLKHVLGDVMRAISAMHSENIVLRELHPDRILVRKDNSSCVLTDMELAKILEVESTVSSQWQPNPYRAPEVASGETRPQADVYSCARLCVHLLTGVIPDFPEDVESLAKCLADNSSRSVLCSSLSPNWKNRPPSLAALQAAALKLESIP